MDKDLAWLGTKAGRPSVFSDAAVQLCLMVTVLLGLTLLQTTAMMANILEMAEINWPVPDLSTLSRRGKSLAVPIPHHRRTCS